MVGDGTQVSLIWGSMGVHEKYLMVMAAGNVVAEPQLDTE